MPSFSAAFLAAVHNQNLDDCILDLCTIESTDLIESPIRIVNNIDPIVSRGDTFYAVPFTVIYPGQLQSRLPIINLVLPAIWDPADPMTGGTVGMVSRMDTGTLKLEMILGSNPNVVERGPFNFRIKKSRADEKNVTLECAYQDTITEPVPGHLMTPATCPGIFKNV